MKVACGNPIRAAPLLCLMFLFDIINSACVVSSIMHPIPNSKLDNHNELVSHKSNSNSFFKRSILYFTLFSLLPFLLHSFKPYLMQFYFYAYTVDKTYMFLICNALLLLIAINSSLQPTIQHPENLELNVSVSPPIAGEILAETESPQVEEKNSLLTIEQENVLSFSDTVVEDEEEGSAIVTVDDDNDDDDDHHDHDVEEAQELNKKCDDFIKRMKAALKNESRVDDGHYFDNQKLLVLVN